MRRFPQEASVPPPGFMAAPDRDIALPANGTAGCVGGRWRGRNSRGGSLTGTIFTMPNGRPSPLDVALDVAGFVIGLGLALALGWRTKDLVWGLWLSSLVIGFASLLVAILGARPVGVSGVAVVGLKVFLVGFFAVHFGIFHFVHSGFLNLFFPLGSGEMDFLPDYAAVLTNYWPWLFAAAIAERKVLLPARGAPPEQPVEPVVPVESDGVKSRAEAKARTMAQLGFNPLGPYRNVIRMHLLIFFFAGMFVIGVDSFAVYVVVYAVYFWPWRSSGWLPGALRG